MTTPPLHPTALRAASDAELVDAVRRGAPGAVDAVHARYAPTLLAFARRLLAGDHHEAEECVQDAFVRAVTALERRPDTDIALKGWLFAIVRNACLDRLRSRALRPVTRLDDAAGRVVAQGADPADAAQRRADLAAVVVGMRRLPERQRTALVLHGIEGRSHAETGARLGIGEGASKALVHRARTGLGAAMAA